MRAVPDTNVLILTGVTHDVVVRGLRGEYEIVVSVETLTEFRETLLKYPEILQIDSISDWKTDHEKSHPTTRMGVVNQP